MFSDDDNINPPADDSQEDLGPETTTKADEDTQDQEM